MTSTDRYTTPPARLTSMDRHFARLRPLPRDAGDLMPRRRVNMTIGRVSRRVCSALIADDLQPFEQRLVEAEGRWLKERAGHLSLVKFGCFVLLSNCLCRQVECANGSPLM